MEPPSPAPDPQQAPPANRAAPARRWIGFLPPLAIALLTFLTYLPAWNGEPLWDDDANITRPELRGFDGLQRIWFEPWATQQYYPLLHSSFWLQQKLLGNSNLGYHLVNILLHVLCVLLFLRLLQRLRVPGALFAAALFALHPVHVESVAWITERKNTLSGIFCLAATLGYLRFDESRSRRHYAIALAWFVLGLLSKTAIVTFPLVLLVLFWWKRGMLRWRHDFLPLVPFFVASVAAGLMTMWIEHANIGIDARQLQFSAIERCLIAGRAIWFDAWKLAWPFDLMFVYPRWQVSAAVWWQYLFPGAVLIVIGTLWHLRSRSRGPLCAVLVFITLALPTLGLLNQYFFVYSFVSDHWQYLPSLGLIALWAAGASLASERVGPGGKLAIHGVCILMISAFAVKSWQLSAIYQNDDTLFRNAIAQNPASWMAHNNLGNLLVSQGRQAEAIECYRETLRIKPDHIEAHYNWANVLVAQGRLDDAIAHYQEALKIEPALAEAHYNWGLTVARQSKTTEAIEHYTKALALKPDYAEAHTDLGIALSARGEFLPAIEHFQQALQLKPDYAVAHYNWGLALAASGRLAEAAEHYRKALQLKPSLTEARTNLGALLAAQGRAEDAIAEYQEALRLQPDSAPAHNNLGLTLAAQGRFDDAILHFQRALQSQPAYISAHYNLGLTFTAARRHREAIAQYLQVVRFKPEFAAAYAKLGEAYLADGAYPDAIKALQRALDLQPGFSEAQASLEKATQVAGQK